METRNNLRWKPRQTPVRPETRPSRRPVGCCKRLRDFPFAFFAAPVSPNNAIISRLNAGMSSGLRLVTNSLSVETDVPPALRMSVLSEGRGWALRRPSLCHSSPSPCHRSARQLASAFPLRRGPASAQAILIARIHLPLIWRFFPLKSVSHGVFSH